MKGFKASPEFQTNFAQRKILQIEFVSGMIANRVRVGKKIRDMNIADMESGETKL